MSLVSSQSCHVLGTEPKKHDCSAGDMGLVFLIQNKKIVLPSASHHHDDISFLKYMTVL
jgi:hypothetical protein